MTSTAAPVALASHNPETQTVTLVIDTATANAVMFAIAGHADEHEAHIREVQSYAQTLPESSYGRRNRHAIAARETRIAARLRVGEHAYRIAIDCDAALTRVFSSRRRLWDVPMTNPLREFSPGRVLRDALAHVAALTAVFPAGSVQRDDRGPARRI